MPHIIDLQQTELHCSSRLAKKEPIYENSNIIHNLFTNYSNDISKTKYKPKLIAERILYAKEITSVLIDNTINHISEFVLAMIDNETCAFKTILQQPDRV